MDFFPELNEIKRVNFSEPKLTNEEWDDFVSRLEYVEVKKNEHVTRAGDLEQYMYFMVDGVMRGYFINKGVEHVIGFSFDYSPSGSIDSFINRKPTAFFTQALADSKLVRIHYNDLQELFDRYKNFERWGRLLMQRLFLMKALHEINVMTHTAEQRFDRLMRESPRCFQLIPLKHLASYLAITPETLSRLRKKAAERT
ncbi:MAG: Crp/Fnr family transcriptional regulator [bacterium]|nr:Crp/Fnr family transcriptional regulator [bacterium]